MLSDEVVARVLAPAELETHPREERERLFFEAMMRVVDRELPGYADQVHGELGAAETAGFAP